MRQKARFSDAPTSFWYKIFFKLSNKHKMGRTLLENVIKIIEIQFSEAHFKIAQLQSKISCLGALSCYTRTVNNDGAFTDFRQCEGLDNFSTEWRRLVTGDILGSTTHLAPPHHPPPTPPPPSPSQPPRICGGEIYLYCSTIDQSMRQRPATLFFRTGGQATVWENMCDKLEI